MAALPLDPPLARAALAAADLGVLPQLAAVAGLLAGSADRGLLPPPSAQQPPALARLLARVSPPEGAPPGRPSAFVCLVLPPAHDP